MYHKLLHATELTGLQVVWKISNEFHPTVHTSPHQFPLRNGRPAGKPKERRQSAQTPCSDPKLDEHPDMLTSPSADSPGDVADGRVVEPRQQADRRQPLGVVQEERVESGHRVNQPVRQLEGRGEVWGAVFI
jgi:hypothetical protein